MAKNIDVCDMCKAQHPEYHFQFRVKRIWHMYDRYVTKYDVCDSCWAKVVKLLDRQKTKRKYTKRAKAVTKKGK